MNFEEVYTRHNIPTTARPAFDQLVHAGKADKQFRRRLKTHLNYQACLDEIMAILSQPLAHLFPPKYEPAY